MDCKRNNYKTKGLLPTRFGSELFAKTELYV